MDGGLKMATMPKCERCEMFYSGLDYCAKCRIADLEDALRSVVDAHDTGGQALLLLKIRAARKLLLAPDEMSS